MQTNKINLILFRWKFLIEFKWKKCKGPHLDEAMQTYNIDSWIIQT